MKSTDLRIGNWYSEFGIPKQVTPQMLLRLYEIEQSGKIAIDVSPLKIDEYWIDYFGLTNLNSIETKGGEIYLELDNKEIGICGVDSCTSGMTYYAKCEFVHQLQNIWHSLNDEELNQKN